MATWLQQFGDWNTNMNAGIFGGKNAAGVMQQASGFGKAMGSLGIDAGNIGGIANTIGQLGTGLLAGQNHSDVGDIMQTVGGLASNIPGVGGLIGAGVGVVGGLINAAFGSNINEEFVSQTKGQANALGSRVFNANTNADLLNDWQSMITQSNVSKSEVGSDGWFSNKASRETRRLNERINEANRRQLANFDIAAQNVDDMNDLRILQNMAAYGGPINSFRKYYANGGLFNTPQFFTFEPQTYDKGGYLNQAKALIRQNEGWSAKPYSDSPKGKNWRSVGYGFNDSGFRDKYPEGISKHYEHGITKKQAEEELDYFLNKAEKRLKSIYGKQWNDFSDSQKAAILDTYYQRPASVDKSSRFYKAVTAGEDAGRYLGVAGYNKRNKVRQDIFGGSYSSYGDWSNTESDSNPSSLQEVTPFTPVVHDLDLSGITPTEAKALELNLTSPTFDLSMFGKPMTTPTQQAVPTVGTVEDFLASYGDFEENLFEKGGGKLNIKDMNIFDFGGGITHGVNWDTGVDYVAEGQSHEQNPYGGVMVGQDEEGTPNLVEEGEYIWNGDYVFSRRMKVPKKLREKYKLPEDATFADAVKVLTKESEERPNDEISRATQDHILGELADSQEELRATKAQRAMDKQMQLQDDFLMGVQFGLGGGLFADGGGIHIDPSKKGTFKAQASKMGMGVQEAASHILANKESYSPAMVKKANFARNSSKWHEDGGNLFTNPFAYGGELGNVFAGEGDKPNSLMYTVDDRSLVRHLFGDNGFTRFMENTAEAINDPIGYFAGDEIEAIMNKVAQMSEPQLQRFFSTGIGQAVADAIVQASDNNGDKQYQEAGMQRWVKATGRMAKPIQKAVVESAKRAMAQSKQIAKSQMKTPKGGGSQKVLNETMTPIQGAKKATTGSTEGLPQGWSFTKGNTPTMSTESIVQGPNVGGARFSGRTTQTSRLNSKSPTGRAAQSRGTAPDPFAGLEGTMNFGTPTSSYLPWVIGTGIGGAGLYQLANMGDDVVASETTSPSTQVTSNKRNENGAGNNSQSSKSDTKLDSPLSGMMLNGNILGVNDSVTNAIISALPSELGSKKSKGTRGSKAGNTKVAAPISTVPADYNWEQEAPWLFGNVAAPTPQGQLRPMEQIARDKSTPTRSVSATNNGTNFGVVDTTPVTTRDGITDNGTDDAGLTRSPFKPKQTWTRYAPLAMNALFGLKEMLTPADYTNANAIMDAAYQVGTPVSIGTEYIGDYRKRDPFDESYLMNIINQNSRAANRNFMNTSGGNRAVAMSGILANDLITQRSLAEAARQAYLANRADDAQVAEFNRGTNIFNAQAQNQRNQYLAGLNSQRQNAMLSGISQGARLRQAIKDQRDAAISANLSAFAQGLGDLGRENGFYNMLGGLNDERILKYFYGDDWNTKFNNTSNV